MKLFFREQDIVKQADTIEELCDEFVVVKEKEHGCNYLYKSAINDYKEHTADALYGAIWTDKGLIYVAKMNERGELELL